MILLETDNTQPPVPDWLKQSLARLREQYPNDRFEALMKHTAVDPKTKQLLPVNEENKGLPHKYVPRVRCLDCLGKVYFANGFESHSKNKKHRETVEARVARES
jgi:SWI/SNF-related matrix-associated actin-dependent regulator of chromatin subfamily B member 1